MLDFTLAAFGGLVVGAFTVLGAVLAVVGYQTKRSGALVSLDFALGMMIAAAGAAMIWPSVTEVYHETVIKQGFLALALLAGWLFIRGLGGVLERRRPGDRAWLFVIAMCLHNIPEGLAAGVSAAELSFTRGLPVIFTIGLQNLPEGLLCFVAFEALGFSRSKALIAASATGLFEFAGGVGAGVAAQFLSGLTPFLLGFAGSAMLTVSIRELRDRLQHMPDGRTTVWLNMLTGFGATMGLTWLL